MAAGSMRSTVVMRSMLRSKEAIAADAGRLGKGDEVGLGEVESVDLVDLDRSQEHGWVNGGDRLECQERADRLGDLLSWRLVERLEYVDGLCDHEVGDEQFGRGREVGGSASGAMPAAAPGGGGFWPARAATRACGNAAPSAMRNATVQRAHQRSVMNQISWEDDGSSPPRRAR